MTHADFIRSLPCLVCLDNTSTEWCHVRYSEPLAGKPITGMGKRSIDAFTVPLCGECHREQHGGGEKKFWSMKGIDPVYVGLALWRASGNHELGEQIVREWSGV